MPPPLKRLPRRLSWRSMVDPRSKLHDLSLPGLFPETLIRGLAVDPCLKFAYHVCCMFNKPRNCRSVCLYLFLNSFFQSELDRPHVTFDSFAPTFYETVLLAISYRIVLNDGTRIPVVVPPLCHFIEEIRKRVLLITSQRQAATDSPTTNVSARLLDSPFMVLSAERNHVRGNRKGIPVF